MTKTKRRVRGIVWLFIGLVLGLVGGLYASLYLSAGGFGRQEPQGTLIVDESIGTERVTVTVENLREAVLPASELSSTKYYYTDADVYENYKEAFGVKIPFTTDEVVFTYDGVISVGIDLEKVQYEIDNENKHIRVILPELRIISNEIDASSFEYPYVFDSIFNDTNMGDYTYLIDRLKEKKAEEIMANDEFMSQARQNTETVIAEFLTASEYCRDFTVEFVSN